MKVAFITGSHPRHRYFAKRLEDAGCLVSCVFEEREEFVPDPPEGLADDLADLFRMHFRKRSEAEEEVFGAREEIDTTSISVERRDLNSDRVVDFLRSSVPDLVLSYGCHKLGAPLRDAVGTPFWNTHGGLSPEYRGVITHFWPSYMLEPQMTGVTLHETTDELDGGAIIHQTGAILRRGDGVHQLAARTIRAYVDEVAPLLAALDASAIPAGISQRSIGKLWRSPDWRPEHLRLVYDTWDDRIVDACLDGRIEGRVPKLISALK